MAPLSAATAFVSRDFSAGCLESAPRPGRPVPRLLPSEASQQRPRVGEPPRLAIGSSAAEPVAGKGSAARANRGAAGLARLEPPAAAGLARGCCCCPAWRWRGSGSGGRRQARLAGAGAASTMRSGLRAPGLLLQLIQLLRCLGFSPASGQTGDGCGHSVLTPYSGTLASKNYPGTYPNVTSCEWRIRGATGSHLSLTFGDMDIEASERCKSGFLLLSSLSDGSSFGPYCSNSNPPRTMLVMNSTSVTILFNSTTHRSGRGFLLSYASGNQPDLISCLQKGIHYGKELIRAYCPAGCKGVPGDISGNSNQGYRDTSVLCKAAVHAGVISDEQGGEVTVSQEKGITLYEPAFANGLYSKRGSLSEKRLIFQKACAGVLEVASFSSSSYWHEQNVIGENKTWSAERAAFSADGASWAADQSSADEWLEIDLGGKRNITGIITKGSSQKHNYYVKSYQVLSSKDGKNWKVYKSNSGSEDKIFEGNSDSHQEVSNAFIPPIVGRYLRIAPQSWNQRAALKVALLGCQASRLKTLRPYSNSEIHRGPKEPSILSSSSPAVFTTIPGIVINSEKTGPPLLVMMLIGGFVLISSALLLLVFLCRKKRKTAADHDCGLVKGYPAPEASQVCSRGTLQLSNSEITSFPGTGTPVDLSGVQSPEYAEPDVVQVSPSSQMAPSTFKPALDEGYTLPLVMNHYDVPGKYHEYAEPLPPEPEYATPFLEQPAELEGGVCRKNVCIIKVMPSSQSHAGSLVSPEARMQYDFPAQRLAEKPDNPDEVDSLRGKSVRGSCPSHVEPRDDRTLSLRNGSPTTPPATSPQGRGFQHRDCPLAHVYHEPL
ncbi:discoidin, CUB and LCCL domain-containing protein 1-like [Elgaria multicarinata webbii]|uniref:discoidin, CUB and LCCL domain-containing protein 1-like n=1 Tax=Elgaria multicarinata webbii TaxID=159646 RepID=UPI002FCD065D